MQFEGRRRARSGPNLTPLIDVVFLLLVFFMLTAHFVTDEAIPVALPEARTAAPLDDTRATTVTVKANGGMTFEGRQVGIHELERLLTLALAGRNEKEVRIRGDRGADLGGAVRVIDVARRAGADAVEIVSEPPDR